MSFLGKVLIVLQVVLSFLFMGAAVAVFSVHSNWRSQFETLQAAQAQTEARHADEVQDLSAKIAAAEAERDQQTNLANAQVADVQRLNRQVAALTQEVNQANTIVNRQTGLAESKSIEANSRQSESEQQRVQNEQLLKTQDDLTKQIQALKDKEYGMGLERDKMITQITALLEQNAFLEKVVRQNGLDTDPVAVAGAIEPPPPVDGLVVEIQKDKTNRTRLVHISIGEDDGLRVQHELDVYRPADQNGAKTQYLGRIRIIHLTPDEAVGIVVQAAKNGIIERGDNVTTRL
jgi:flagellar basal body-associated protein FliL